MVKRLILFLLLTSQSSYAQPIYGIDVLGLAMQDTQMIAQEIPLNYAIGVLEGTFGPSIPPLERLINTGKVTAFRAHLGNGPCQRAHNCAPGEPPPNDLQTMRNRALAFESLALRHPSVKCYLSPYLEHDVKDKNLVNSWVALLHKNAPHCEVVMTAFTGYVPPGVLNEQHGNTKRGDIVSNDGASLFDSNSANYRTLGKFLVLGWVPRCNLRVSGELTFTPPKQRKNKLTRDNVKQIVRLLSLPEPKLQVSNICPHPIEFARPELNKTNAEDHGNGDIRADKPLYILKVQSQIYNLISPTGIVLGCAKYFGGYPPNLYRNYVGSCSGETGVQLMDKAHSEWGYLKGGGRCYLVNWIRRLGYYQ